MLQEQLFKFWGRQQNFGALYQINYSYAFIVEHSSPQENVLFRQEIWSTPQEHKASFPVTDLLPSSQVSILQCYILC